MTKITKHLETLSKNIIKIIREFNDIPTENLSILSKRLGLLKELSNALPVINELINQLELDEQDFSIGMTTED
jgi:hypothetical protein